MPATAVPGPHSPPRALGAAGLSPWPGTSPGSEERQLNCLALVSRATKELAQPNPPAHRNPGSHLRQLLAAEFGFQLAQLVLDIGLEEAVDEAQLLLDALLWGRRGWHGAGSGDAPLGAQQSGISVGGWAEPNRWSLRIWAPLTQLTRTLLI